MIEIKKVLTAGVISTSLVFGLIGCGKEPIPPKQVKTSKIDTINIEYKFNDKIQNISVSKQDFIHLITSNTANNSKYANKIIKNNPVKNTYGKVVEYNNGMLTINYLNGNQNCGKDCASKYGQVTQVIFNIKLDIKEKSENNFLISASFPQQYTIKPDSSLIGSEFDPLDKPSKLELDAKRMFNSLKDKPFTLNKTVEFKGEINTKYPDIAVYANFKRILGEFTNWRYFRNTSNEKITEDKKQNSFILKINDKSYPLYVEIYPYRDGSKVIYSTTLKYTIDSKGNSTLDTKDILELHKKIKAIINN